jgi:hypothetical protein
VVGRGATILGEFTRNRLAADVPEKLVSEGVMDAPSSLATNSRIAPAGCYRFGQGLPVTAKGSFLSNWFKQPGREEFQNQHGGRTTTVAHRAEKHLCDSLWRSMTPGEDGLGPPTRRVTSVFNHVFQAVGRAAFVTVAM